MQLLITLINISESWPGLGLVEGDVKLVSCGRVPYTLTVRNIDEVTHLEAGNYIYECKMRFREILWSNFIEAVK